jgi:signal transduction histidine kinase/CheY-like chemotaxis protein
MQHGLADSGAQLPFVPVGLSGKQLQNIFPFHFAINQDFIITQLGDKLARFIPGIKPGTQVQQWFRLILPSCAWSWGQLSICRDAAFELAVVNDDKMFALSGGFYVTKIEGDELSAIFLLHPNISSVTEMLHHNLAWSDFGRYSSHQRLVLFAEHLKAESESAVKSKAEALSSQQSLEMKRMFVRYVSHEIRTPLNTVSMGLELLQSCLSDDSAQGPTRTATTAEGFDVHGMRDMIAEVKESCDIAVNILSDLLLYEKLEGGILALEKRCEPALAVVYDAVKTFKIQARQADIELDCTFDGAVFAGDELSHPTAFVDVDKPKISQVFRNLVSNAIKFSALAKRTCITDTPCDRIIVHVSVVDDRNATLDSQPKKLLRVEVVDFGPGISLENQAKLFDQIIQFEPNKMQGGGGSGIGLYISKNITDLHGGDIGVFSEGEGKGCRFHVDIPIHFKSEPCPLTAVAASHVRGASGPLKSTFNIFSASPTPTSLARTRRQQDRSQGTNVFLAEWRRARPRPTSPPSHPIEKRAAPTATAAPRVASHSILRRHTLSDAAIAQLTKTADPARSIHISMFPLSPRSSQETALSRKSPRRKGPPLPSASSWKQASITAEVVSSLSPPGPVKPPALPYHDIAPPRTFLSVEIPSDDAIAASGDVGNSHCPSTSGSQAKGSPSSVGSTGSAGRRATFPFSANEVLLAPRRSTPKSSSLATPREPAFPVITYKVLVVDDSVPNRKILTRLLKVEHMCDDVAEAASGLDAVRIVRDSFKAGPVYMPVYDMSHRDSPSAISEATISPEPTYTSEYSAILMDSSMPVMDGPTATKLIREAGYKGLIVGVTGNVLPEDKAYFLSQGADAVMTKPMDMKELRALLSSGMPSK